MDAVKASGLSAIVTLAIGLAWTPNVSASTSQAGSPLSASFSGRTILPATPSGGALLAREVASLTAGGMQASRAKEALAVEGRIGRADLQSKLLAAMGSGFGGVWFDLAAARLHIGVTSLRGQRAAERTVARAGLSAYSLMTAVPSSWSELLAVQRGWDRRLARLLRREDVGTALAPQSNAVIVTVSSSVSTRERARIKRAAAAEVVKVFVSVVREPHLRLAREANLTTCGKFVSGKAYCNKPITPGVTIENADEEECTAGPLVFPKKDKQRTYLLTAGHCVDDGLIREKWYSYTTGNVKLEIGRSASYRNNSTGDVGLVIVNRPGSWVREGNTPVFPVTAEWKKLSETSYEVNSQKAPMVGDADCFVGEASGGGCGTVLRVNAMIAGMEGVAESSAKGVQKGDSGGAVIVETEGGEGTSYAVEGTVIGRLRSNGNLIFESLERAFTLLKPSNLELLAPSNEVRPEESAEEKAENANIEKSEKEEQEQREKEEKEDPLISPAPTTTSPVEFTSTNGKTILEATGGNKIECKEGTSSGEFYAVRAGRTTITLHGCKSGIVGCKTSGQPAETIAATGEVQLVDLEKTKLTLGIEIELNPLHVECTGINAVLEGPVIGEASGVESGKATKTATATFKQEKGKQAIRECHLAKTFCEGKTFTPEVSINGGLYEEAGMEVEDKFTFGKETTVDF